MIKVLFIDDEADVLDQAKMFLVKQGPDITVDTAISAEKALEKIEENGYEVIVSDYQMPEMDGLELLQKLREDGNEIPFIFLTGRGREEVAMKALNLGADRYLTKGGKPKNQYSALAQVIEQEAERKRAEEERKRMQKELKKSEKRYRIIFEHTGTAMVIVEEDGTISLANQKFEELSGYPSEEIEDKKKLEQFASERDVEKVKKYHKMGTIDSGLTPKSFEFKLLDKNNTEKDIFATFTWIPEWNNCIASFFDFTGFSEAISELKHISEALFTEDVDKLEKHLSSIAEELFTKEDLKKRIKDWSLDELFLLIIANRDGANGKELTEDLERLFDIHLSSSTVYPRLHQMEEDGVLWKEEHIRTKEYHLEDEEEALNLVTKKIKQLFGIYAILKLLSTNIDKKWHEPGE